MIRHMQRLRVVFMGSPSPVLRIMRVVQELGYELVAVYTTPDQPSGRGRKLEPTPVKRYAASQGLLVYEPATLRSEAALDQFRFLSPDLVVLAAYGKLLPRRVLETPRWGCVNIHPSLLPRHRGASPVAFTILEGDAISGVTLIRMDEGLDTGPVIAKREIPVLSTDRTPELTERLFGLGAELLREALPEYLAGTLVPRAQPAEGVTVTRRLAKEDGELDWRKTAARLDREVRAYFPWPGSATLWQGRRLQVVEAGVASWSGRLGQPLPGAVIMLSDRPREVGVATADGVLALRQVKLEGRPAMKATEFLQGYPGFLDSMLPS
jgi:methionyl-tRNA formyltransferase